MDLNPLSNPTESSADEQEELLALLLAEAGFDAPTSAIIPAPRPEYPALSFAQQRLWFLNQLEPGSPTYNIPVALRLTGLLNVAALEQSLRQIVRRHEALRTTFKMLDDQPVQVIAPPETAEVYAHLTVQEVEADDVPRQALAEACRPFDLAQGPLLRATLLRSDESHHVLLLTLHHIIADGWSLGVLFEELVALYPALAAGKPSPLAELPLQYTDFAEWQRQWLQGEVRQKQLAYWQKQLAGAPPVLQLPMARSPKPGRYEYRRGAVETFTLSSALTKALRTLSAQTGATLFMTLLAAFQTLLYRYTHQADLSVGTLIANRNRPEIEGLLGVFINALTLRGDLSGNPTFLQLLERVRQVALDAYTHQDLPFEMLVEELHPERDLYHTPLFQVMFVLQNAPWPSFQLPQLEVSIFDIDNGTAVYDLIFEMTEQPDGLAGNIRYDTDMLEAADIRAMIGHFETLLTAITANPHQTISTLPLLTLAEQQQLLVEWNATAQTYPLELCAHQLFEARVAQTPEAIAVVCAGEPLTYCQLNQRANHLAWRLIQAGVGPEVVVALLAERGLDLLTMILAVFKAGGAYLPLDPLHPAPRLAQILQRSRTPLVLLTPEFGPILTESLNHLPQNEQPQLFELDPLWPQPLSTENPPLRTAPGHLAYVIYTSGSTGVPKGAMVEHTGMVNHLYAKITDLNLTAADRIAQNSSQCFDISVWQFLAALLVGGTVHIYPNDIAYHPLHLLDHVRRDQITVLQVVPSMLRAIIQEIADTTQPDLSALRWIVPTGEALTTELCRQWLQLYPQIPMMNAYGSTECSDDQCHHPIYQPLSLDSDMPTMPIGRPLANTQVYILDQKLAPVPVGVTGELYIGGTGVGRGYLNEPIRTAEVFIPDPFGPQPGRRLYKTGDSARYLPDGVIEFLGRVDFMVKIRGFRIELGEIEAALEQHPHLAQAVVMAPDSQRLVAYLVAEQPLTAEELRHYLKQKLPEYMVPSFFMFLEAIPLNANGKVDRKALPKPDSALTSAAETYLPPRTPIEQALADLWANILGLEQVSVRDNFFELGGHSLLAVRLMAQIHKHFGQDLPLATLFEAATVEHLAEVLQQRKPVLPAPLVGIQPLSPDDASSQPPFFFVHPADGTVFSYVNLARHLGQNQPFYGLQAAGLQGEQPPQTQIEAMAADYIRAMQVIQPCGPYLLGGWSMGSIVAFEMAQQLQRSGQPVALLVLLDHQAPPFYHPDATVAAPDDQILLTTFLQDLYGRFAQDQPPLPDNLWQLNPDEQLNLLLAQAKMLEVVLPDGGLLQIHRLLQIFKANVRAMWDYTPHLYPGRIILFKAAEVPPLNQAEPVEMGADPTLGWGQLSTQPVIVHLTPGNHYSMLSEPAVQLLAKQIRAYLDEIQK